MAQSILCPQCEKRFRLSDNPPAQATCSGCGTLMDLTAFGGGDQPAAPAAAPSGRPRPKPHRASRAGTRRRRPSPRGAARGGRGRGPQQQAPQQPAMSAGTQGILIFVGVLIVVLIFVVSGKKDADDVPDTPSTTPIATQEEPEDAVPYTPEPIADPGKRAKPEKKKRKVPLNRRGKPRLSRVELTTHAWPEEVGAEVRAKADEAIRKMYVGGRDGVEAADWLVQQGRPICGRLISEFRAIEASPGFTERDGAAMAMVIDGTLRKIDGQIERYWEEPARIRAWGAYASPQFITRIAKRWTWWWIEEEWKDNPRKPWDPFEDESDTTPDGIKREEPKKDPKKKGYGKRAGSGD